jgi:carbon monoxide dehydrogenase subunit G
MVDVERSFTVAQPMDVVVGYLADFAHAESWDPGTQSCTPLTDGPVVVGKQWHNVSEIKGHQTELTYTLSRQEADHLTFVGENKGATSTDDLSFASTGDGTRITYHASIELHGLLKIIGPFAQHEFEKLGDATERQLTEVLNAL